MSKKLLIIIISVLVVALGATAFGIYNYVYNTPENVAGRTLSNLSDDFLERDEFEFVTDVLKEGSIQLSLTGIERDGEDYFEDSHIKGKLYFSEDAIFLTDVDVKLDGGELEGEAYVSKDGVYISEDHILEGAYGVDFSTVIKELGDSIFAPDSDSDYALDEDTYDFIVSLLENMQKSEELSEKFGDLFSDISEDLWNIVVDNADISSANKKIQLNGQTKSVRLITITIDAKAAENIVSDVYKYIKDSKDIADFVEENAELIDAVLFDFYYFYPYDRDDYDSFAEFYEEWIEELEEEVEELCDEIADDFEKLTVEIATPKRSATLLKLEVKYDGDSLFLLDCGPDGIKKTNQITLEIADYMKASYTVKEDSKKEFVAELKIEFIDGEDEEEYVLKLDVDKEAGKYSVSYKELYSYEWESYVYDEELGEYDYDSPETYTYEYTSENLYKGKYSSEKNTTTLTLDSITERFTSESNHPDSNDYEDEDVIDLKCKVIINTDDKMPKLPSDYTKISEITEDDIEAWFKKLDDLD